VNRKRKLEQLAQPEGQTIQDIMQKSRMKRRFTTACPPPSLRDVKLDPPKTVDVTRFLSNLLFISIYVFSLHFLSCDFHCKVDLINKVI